MSDDDKESKTEEATEKKIQDALERGETPFSRDLVTSGAFFGIYLATIFARNSDLDHAGHRLANILDYSGSWRLRTGPDAWMLTNDVAKTVFAFMVPVCAIMMGVILAVSLSQNMPRFVLKRITPDFSRINPAKGFTRIISRKGLTEFLKSLGKLTTGALVAACILRGEQSAIMNSMLADPRDVIALIWRLAIRLMLAIAIMTLVIALFDLIITRMGWRKDLRMSKQEIKDEMKQSEGDPMVKARLRSLAMDRSRRRMINDVARASVVLVNPVHYAIALRYVREEGGAPVVLAKGQELLALKIRERATELGIPVIENPPLVRAMYDHAELSQMIPAQFYRAIADVINLISKKKA